MENIEKTISAYEKDPLFHANKFDRLGVRKSCVDAALHFLKTEHFRCLELGSGNGRDASYIVSRVTSYIGIDASKGMVELAKKNVPGAVFISGDFRALSFPGRSFDVIFAFASFLHIPPEDVRVMFEKMADWLDDSGVFFVSFKLGEGRIVKKDETGERIFYLYTPESFTKLSNPAFRLIYAHQSSVFEVPWVEMAFKLDRGSSGSR